ncbi:MAG: hypothetical protein ACRCTZ_10695 [Sarcina sp.]
MSVIHYWSENINKCKEYIKNDKFIVNLSVKDLAKKTKISKYFFFESRVELIKFMKYVVLPTFVYNKINKNKNIEKLNVQDYKDVLNYFMCNEIKDSKELIKRYSYFYNSLEEFEYEVNYESEEAFIELIEAMDKYFSKNVYLNSNIKIYFGAEEFLQSILESNDMYFYEKLINNLGAKNKEELKCFLNDNKDNEAIINFLTEVMSEIQDGKNITINI